MNDILDDEEVAMAMAMANQEANTGDNTEPLPIEEPSTDEIVPSIETSTIPEIPVSTEQPIEQSGNCCGSCCENLTIGQYFGTLMESVVIVWKYHLMTNKYQSHETLYRYYREALVCIDTLIENYQGRFGIVNGYDNCICGCDMTDVTYLQNLRDFTDNGAQKLALNDVSELRSDVDTYLSLLDSTIYKLVNLTESKKVSNGKFLKFDEFCK